MRSKLLSRAPWRASLVATALLAAAVPMAHAAAPDSSDKKPYVVILKDRSANAKGVAGDHSRRFGVAVKTLFDKGLRGYAGLMTDGEAKKVAGEPGVVIAPDSEVTGFETVQDLSTTPNPPYQTALPSGWGWHLDRIDQRLSLAANGEKNKYHYDKTGADVTAFVIDSGVNYNHKEFSGGRASPGFDAYRATGTADFGKDCNGHGTHVAGILGGQNFGVAKGVKIVSVRVLDCNGSGTVSNVVNGINYVTGQKQRPENANKAMVANMSLGGATNNVLDEAVRQSINAGITYSIAAGNGNIFGNGQDACSVSPARVATALTVAATDTSDRRTSWSNYGSCVDVYAPGNNVVSSYGATQDTTAWKSLSGTSMAAPAVAGVAAILLQMAPGASPAKVMSTLSAMATTGVVTGSNTSGARLLFEPWSTVDVPAASCRLANSSGCPDPSPSPAPGTTPPAPSPSPCFIFCGIFSRAQDVAGRL